MSEPKRGPGRPEKPPKLKRRPATFRLSPEVVKLLKAYNGNRTQLIEKLLIEYFERLNNEH